MTSTAALKATALPMPELTLTGEKRTVGNGTSRGAYPTATCGDRTLLVGRSGATYTECAKCHSDGFIREYAGIYQGVCFKCNGAGVRHYAADADKTARKVRSAQAAALRNAANAQAAAAEWEAGADARLAAAWDAALSEDAARAATAAERAAYLATKRHAGAEGAKVTVTGKVVTNVRVESHFGYRTIYKRLVIVEGTGDDAGITLKACGTADCLYSLERGQEITMTATVKAHGTYNDVPQTEVIRPKVA